MFRRSFWLISFGNKEILYWSLYLINICNLHNYVKLFDGQQERFHRHPSWLLYLSWLDRAIASEARPNDMENTVYPKKYAHGFVVLCFVVVMQSFIMNSHEVFIQIHQGCFAGTGAIVRLPQCQWSKPDGYGKISQCITTTKYSKAKTVCIFLGI